MNLANLMNSSFGAASAARLGQAVGLDAGDATRVLHAALPLQLAALGEHARTAEGRDQIAEAVQNLPAFASVEDALGSPEGAPTLESAGQLLTPALLGGRASGLAAQVAGGLDTGRVERLLHLALPLLLSFLGQRGLRDGDVAALLARPLEESAAPTRVVLSASPAISAVAAAPGQSGTAPGSPDEASPAGLLDFLRAPFSGAVAERLGTAAGFSGNTAVRATQAALPVLLAALARKGGSEAGAADLLARSRDTGGLVGADGRLNADRLSDPAEVARIEGQGRPLLGSLFGNVDEVTGRLGSAIGGSGTSAGRLLALLAPLVLGLLGQRVAAGGLKPAALAGLLAGLPGQLAGTLPAGMPGLGVLLDRVGREPVAVVTAAPQVRTAPAPRPAAPPASAVPPAPREARARRRGFPWWLIPLLLLLGLGGCWLLQPRPETTSSAPATGAANGAAPATNGIVVTTPASGASLPAAPLTLSGTAPAGETLTVSEDGEQLAAVTVQQDGGWSAELPAPAPGEHTYTVSGSGGSSELTVNVAGGAAGSAGESQSGAAGAAANDAGEAVGGAGTFTISEPAPNAQLPAGTFTLRGTGTPGQTVQLLEDGTSLGDLTVGQDGTWSRDVPSPAAGEHTYTVQTGDGTELGRVTATVAAAPARTDSCRDEYTLSISDGQTVGQPFRFGGVGQGEGYRVTVKRGDRVVGNRTVPLDNTCGWSYQSRPGAGELTYEVRPLGEAAAEPLSVVTLTVTD